MSRLPSLRHCRFARLARKVLDQAGSAARRIHRGLLFPLRLFVRAILVLGLGVAVVAAGVVPLAFWTTDAARTVTERVAHRWLGPLEVPPPARRSSILAHGGFLLQH